jgi:hypothetical protein
MRRMWLADIKEGLQSSCRPRQHQGFDLASQVNYRTKSDFLRPVTRAFILVR